MNWLRRWWRTGLGWKWGYCRECGGEAEVYRWGSLSQFCSPCRDRLRAELGLPPLGELERD